jgi:dTDP-4-dehydrorhamnose 3,5-epimerase
MRIEQTPLQGLLLLHPTVFRDPRGWFLESFNEENFRKNVGVEAHFVQDNESLSQRGVLRGLHFQTPPHAQAKLVRVVQGSVLDVCLDIRPSSATFGQHFKVELSGEEKNMLWIPEGFAHGFRTLEDNTIFSYKCTSFYNPACERTVLWNDPDLAIDWGVVDPVLSGKDQKGLAFNTLRQPR